MNYGKGSRPCWQALPVLPSVQRHRGLAMQETASRPPSSVPWATRGLPRASPIPMSAPRLAWVMVVPGVASPRESRSTFTTRRTLDGEETPLPLVRSGSPHGHHERRSTDARALATSTISEPRGACGRSRPDEGSPRSLLRPRGRSDNTTTDLFEFQPVVDGVYAAIAAPQYNVNSNAAVILTNDGVVVVDSHSKPSAAKALYTEIRGVTKNPVSKIINTHFHWDHWQGSEVYAAEFPNHPGKA
jgi:hypothetical protein